jgi:3-deoxy-7-phosphoheptulonate synthase
MITVLKSSATQEQRDHLIQWLNDQNVQVHVSQGSEYTVLGLVGDTTHIDMDLLASLEIVESVKRVSEPFKKCNRKFHPDDSIIDAGSVKIGGGNFAVIAGPCSVENHDQILEVAEAVKKSGANLLRGGAFKPRTSPYDFQGLHGEGLRLLSEAKKATGLPIVTELMDMKDFDLFADVDAEGSGSHRQDHSLEAWPCQQPEGASHERRIHHVRRQREGHSLRARRAHL